MCAIATSSRARRGRTAPRTASRCRGCGTSRPTSSATRSPRYGRCRHRREPRRETAAAHRLRPSARHAGKTIGSGHQAEDRPAEGSDRSPRKATRRGDPEGRNQDRSGRQGGDPFGSARAFNEDGRGRAPQEARRAPPPIQQTTGPTGWAEVSPPGRKPRDGPAAATDGAGDAPSGAGWGTSERGPRWGAELPAPARSDPTHLAGAGRTKRPKTPRRRQQGGDSRR